MKVTVLVHTLNEIDGMKAIMPKLKKEWYDQMLIVDGGSTDGTIEYAKEHGYEIVVQKRKGPRFAYNEVMPYISGDVVIPFSPDGNSIPEVIPLLVEKIKEGYDMVTASRYLDGAKSYDDTLITKFGNYMFTKLINIFHGGHYTDAMVMYRAWKKSLFVELDLDKDESYSPEKFFRTIIGIDPLLSIRAAKRKLKVTEIPGDEPLRIGGEKKLKVFQWGGAYMVQVFRELFYWR
jgi:glycosyltransferase involved in cell wall biosynthesis